MRDIKFRAWHDDREMVYPPFNLHIKDHMTMLMLENGVFGYHGSSVHLMQYTGLQDRNGVDIYEGDIYKTWAGHGPFVVEWGQQGDDLIWGWPVVGEGNEEVIGNVYEDPDLVAPEASPSTAA